MVFAPANERRVHRFKDTAGPVRETATAVVDIHITLRRLCLEFPKRGVSILFEQLFLGGGLEFAIYERHSGRFDRGQLSGWQQDDKPIAHLDMDLAYRIVDFGHSPVDTGDVVWDYDATIVCRRDGAAFGQEEPEVFGRSLRELFVGVYRTELEQCCQRT